MIQHYSDHAANERTFLAWVRTAIAVMGFGFIIERFDIFLATMASGHTSSRPVAHGFGFANEAGLAFILIGVAMTVISAVRFFRIAKQIDQTEAVASLGSVVDLALAALLVLLGFSLFLLSLAFCAALALMPNHRESFR
jgi:putative membrane protein